MKFKDYSENTWRQIQQTLDLVLKNETSPIAVFDADGTLWDTDLGEDFFQYQIHHQLVPLPPQPWEHYHQLKKKNNDPREAYLWLAQICAGKNIAEIRGWAESAVTSKGGLPIFEPQKKLISLFLSKRVRVYIVTASVKWAVEPGARLLGLTHDSVIGVQTLIENNVITKTQYGQMTYREGKALALLNATNGQKPFFACGNTMGDFELIKSATHLHLAVSGAAVSEPLYATETLLLEEAKKQQWLTHRFV